MVANRIPMLYGPLYSIPRFSAMGALVVLLHTLPRLR